MRLISIIIGMAFLSVTLCAQNTKSSKVYFDKNGHIKSADYFVDDKSVDVLNSANDFFSKWLDIKLNDEFRKNESLKLDNNHDNYQQFYKGVRVEEAGFTFHYDSIGHLYSVHGNYIDIDSLEVVPVLSSDKAVGVFAKSLGIRKDEIEDYLSELVIVNVKDQPMLAYKIFIFGDKPCDLYGYVDALRGDIVRTLPIVSCAVSTGQFHTKYNGDKYAQTTHGNGGYYLYDNSRGASIHTMDKRGSLGSQYEITDNDNNWYQAERVYNTWMALDVHWGLQQIYDRLYTVYGKNGFDNNGHAITAYTDALINFSSDNAAWYRSPLRFFHFGSGEQYGNPWSALDIVAHEYGHAITESFIGWPLGELRYEQLDEGLSDVWAAIMDYRFGPTGSDPWKFGEAVYTLSATSYFDCIRNLANPKSLYAPTQGPTTYLSSSYLSSSDDGHAKGCIFGHWFYLLVNGGQGYNENGEYYNLTGVGMDVAENLIVHAVYDGFLLGRSSFTDVRIGFISAANSLGVAGLGAKVASAWDAVGVKDRSISGSTIFCNQSVYTIDVPSSTNVQWSVSNNSAYIVSGQGTNTVVLDVLSGGRFTLSASIMVGNSVVEILVMPNVICGTPDLGVRIIPKASNGDTGYWTSNYTAAYNSFEVEDDKSSIYNRVEAQLYRMDSYFNPTQLVSSWTNISTSSALIPGNSAGWYLFRLRGINSCGYSEWLEQEIEMVDLSANGFLLSYDLRSNIITLTMDGISSSSGMAHKGDMYEIEIWNSTGLVKQLATDNSVCSLSIANFPPGIYVVRVVRNGRAWSRKFVKR